MNSGELRVVVDANVLASRTLTDWLFNFRRHGRISFAAIWSRDIEAETVRVLRRRNPSWPGEAIERRHRMLESSRIT